MHGPDHDVQALTVAVCWYGACLALADADDGDVFFVSPAEGGPFRRYLAGDHPPFSLPMRREPCTLVSAVAMNAGVDRETARKAVRDTLEHAPGAGGELYREVEALLRKGLKFGDLTTLGEAPID